MRSSPSLKLTIVIARAFRLERQRRNGFVKAQSGPDRPDAVPMKDVERLPEAFQAIVENVIVGQAGDFERDRGQAGDMRRQALEDRAALPNRLAGPRQGAFAVDDPEVGGSEGREHVPIDGLRLPRNDRLESADRRPIRSDHDPQARFRGRPGTSFLCPGSDSRHSLSSGSSRSMCSADPYLMNAATLWA